jgi:hypothetical protein
LIQHDATLADAATSAKAAFLAAATAANNQRSALKPFFVGLKAYVKNQFTDPNGCGSIRAANAPVRPFRTVAYLNGTEAC